MGKVNRKNEDETKKSLTERFSNTPLTIVIVILSIVLVGGIIYLIILLGNKNKAQALDNFNTSQGMSSSVSDLPPVTDGVTDFAAPAEVVGQYSDTSSMDMGGQPQEVYNKLLNSVTSDL